MKRAILYVVAIFGCATVSGSFVKKLWEEKYKKQRNELSTSKNECGLLYKWLQLSQKGMKLSEYFSTNSFSKVAVFGMNREGRLVIEDLGDLAVYGVEKENLGAVHERLMVYRLGDDPLPPADCMVLCSLDGLSEKLRLIQKEFPGKLLTLEQVLTWLEHESTAGRNPV